MGPEGRCTVVGADSMGAGLSGCGFGFRFVVDLQWICRGFSCVFFLSRWCLYGRCYVARGWRG